MKTFSILASLLYLATVATVACSAEPEIAFRHEENRLQITCGGTPLATYVYRDDQIMRPYFMHVHAPAGVRVTRNHPPIQGRDLEDHPTFHPGIWLAFGDLSGADYWRNRAKVQHVAFVQEPQAETSKGSFSVKNRYLAGDDALCEEICRVTIRLVPTGYRFDWDSTFDALDEPVHFGDQEEMGLGVRVATPLAVQRGGQIQNSDGRLNEAENWGQQANWCAYSGAIGGTRVGVAIMPHPDNFRQSWFHARDYGLLVANPFGRAAFAKGEPSRVTVAHGKSLRLRFGVLVYGDGSTNSPDLEQEYQRYIRGSDTTRSTIK